MGIYAMTSHGMAEPSWAQRLLDQFRFRLRNRALKYVQVEDGEHRYTFRCETPIEIWRAMTLLVKEEGTVRWLRAEVKPGDVFYDVGANIGPYTLMAAKRVGSEGTVYAFEPHVANLHSLMHNVSLNGLGQVVKVMSCALYDKEGFFDFNYYTWLPGSSMSQLNDCRDDHNNEFRPVFFECKFATTIDKLIEKGVIRPASLIKIDVDGNKLPVLNGMQNLLSQEKPPRSLLVEINVRNKHEIYEFLHARGFEETERQHWMQTKGEIVAGRDPGSLNYNAVFKKKRY